MKINKKYIMIAFLMTMPVFTKADLDCGAFVDITKPLAQIIMIAAPIILLVLGTVDFGRAVGASDEKAMKKAISDFVKRLVICIVILILPVLINMIMGWIKWKDLTACW